MGIDPTDEDLVARVIAGDTAQFASIVQRYNRRLFRLLRSILRDDAEAEDALQQAYLAAYRHLASFDGRARVSTWLTRIAIHEALARHRGKRRRALLQRGLAIEPPASSRRPDEVMMRQQHASELERAIDALPHRYRVVVMMREVEELSTAEVAAALDLSEENVRVRLHRGRQLLRARLHQNPDLRAAFAFAGERCARIARFVMKEIDLRVTRCGERDSNDRDHDLGGTHEEPLPARMHRAARCVP
jgi:RNA polymerase sigma-70 factor (ECF subfamily)